MDKIKNKAYPQYDYLSRYTGVPYYYHTEDKKYFFGLSKNMLKNISYVSYEVQESDTLDSIALEKYNNPTLYWVIALFNDILDVYAPLKKGSILKIPNVSNIGFGDMR